MAFRYKKIILLILILALAVIFYVSLLKEEQAVGVHFLNVGQGDAILVVLPGDIQILIDGGPSDAILSVLGRYIPFYDKEIELVILTHPHADHLRGINHVLNHYGVKNILLSGADYDSNVYRQFMELLKTEGARLYLAQTGDKIMWAGRNIFTVLSPQEQILGDYFSDIHESNIVTKLSLGEMDFLLMGDAEVPLEEELVRQELIGDVDVLKVGHHGSKTSSGTRLLSVALPEVAIISVGNNSYGHPYPAVLKRLDNLGSTILRTDEVGDISWTFRPNQ